MKSLPWWLLLVMSLITPLFNFLKKAKPMTDTSIIGAQAQAQTQPQAPAPTLNSTLTAIETGAQIAGSLIPGAGQIANTVAETAQTIQAVEPAVDSVLTALLPLLIAAGHNIGAEWTHLVGAAKTVAK
jgi:hypothetical protein